LIIKYVSLAFVSILAIFQAFLQLKNIKNLDLKSKKRKIIIFVLIITGIVFTFFELNVTIQDSRKLNELIKDENAKSTREIKKHLSEIDSAKYNEFKPEIEVKLRELKDDILEIEIYAPRDNKCEIDRMYVKLDIPGVFIKFEEEIENTRRISDYEINNSFSSGDPNSTITEMIELEINNIYSEGFLRGKIHYKPYGITKQIKNNSVYFYHQAAWLHKYLTYKYSWLFDGTKMIEKGHLDLTNLKYQKQDKNDILYHKSYLKRSIKDQLKFDPQRPISKWILDNNVPIDINDSLIVVGYEDFRTKQYYIITRDTLVQVIENKPDSILLRMFYDPIISQNMKDW